MLRYLDDSLSEEGVRHLEGNPDVILGCESSLPRSRDGPAAVRVPERDVLPKHLRGQCLGRNKRLVGRVVRSGQL